MAIRCVLCGKSYAKKVSAAHLKGHKVSAKQYEATEAALSATQWEFYWTHPGIQVKFTAPATDAKGPGGGLTFKEWCEKTGVV